jgi:hypothetical protein
MELYDSKKDIKEISDDIQAMLRKKQPDMKVGYMPLFNITVKPIKYLTFPYYEEADVKWKHRLHELQALTAFQYVECDFDYVVFVQGLEGIGKSTYALKMVDALRKLGKEFDMKKDMITKAWEYPDVVNRMEEAENSVMFFDEGKKFFDLRRSMHPERIDMLEFFTTERWRRNVYIIAVSDLTEIDKYFRERRAKAITLLPDRGLAYMLHSVNLFGVGQDRFFLERFENMISSDKNSFHFERQLSLLMKLPTCYGFGLTDKYEGGAIWDEYYKLKTESQTTAQKNLEKKLAQRKLSEA